MIIKEKINQSIEILNELNIDMWLTFCRESETTPDPALDLIAGRKVVAQSAFLISKTGDTTAIVATMDAADFLSDDIFQTVIPCKEHIADELLQKLHQLNPGSIAINFSKNSVSSDGLTHGMYLLLTEYLKDTPYLDKLISSEEIQFRVRGRKNNQEIDLIKKAATIAEECWRKSIVDISAGMSEIEIAAIIEGNIKNSGFQRSFPTIVNAGAKTAPGHGSPTHAVLEEGDLLHVDFGAIVEGYCSDIQRLAYFKRQNESTPPESLLSAFDKVKTIIDVTSEEYKTGAIGHEIDAIAR